MIIQYSQPDAQVQMTLAAVSYAGDAQSANLPVITKAIKHELTNVHYATKAEWTCVWGPVLSTEDNNVAYVAKLSGASVFSIVLRGTTMTVKSWWEDVPTGQSDISQIIGSPGKVSDHFLSALNDLLKCESGGRILGEFITDESQGVGDMRVYVTGHSQGGGLTPIFTAWAQRHTKIWKNTGKKEVVGYAFAPPTSGDPDFANWVSQNLSCYQVINPLDVVPMGYNRIRDIRANGIPETVPHWVTVDHIPIDLWAALDAAADVADLAGQWKQPETQKIQSPHPMDSSVYDYLQMVSGQHNHNSYLGLLSAPQSCIGTPSPLPKMTAPTWCPTPEQGRIR